MTIIKVPPYSFEINLSPDGQNITYAWLSHDGYALSRAFEYTDAILFSFAVQTLMELNDNNLKLSDYLYSVMLPIMPWEKFFLNMDNITRSKLLSYLQAEYKFSCDSIEMIKRIYFTKDLLVVEIEGFLESFIIENAVSLSAKLLVDNLYQGLLIHNCQKAYQD